MSMHDTASILSPWAPGAGGWTVAQDGSSTGMFGSNPGAGGAGTTAAPGTPGPGTTSAPAPGGAGILYLLPIFLLGIIVLSWWTNKKEKKKRDALISSVGKNDLVLTIGGMIGTVTEIQDDRIILRVDDANKTKIAFTKSSVQQVIRSANTPATASIETKSAAEKSPV
ncbi:MAG: preprotein translocase subunit YajC [Phycisphaerales bacterium]